jgi:hypothetical protein
VLVLAYVLRHTAWGRHVYAVGDDPEAAELSGVNVKRTLMSVYMLSGLICAFAGWALIGRIGSVSPLPHRPCWATSSITAVVIGGISLFGGRGSILGALFGALIVGVFDPRPAPAGADAQWTYLLIGVLIIAPLPSTSGSERFRHERTHSQGRNLVKRFGKVTALDHCDFDSDAGRDPRRDRRQRRRQVDPDQGALRRGHPRRGRDRLDGKRLHFRSPIEAREAGIETVYQTLAMSPALSIADNMFMGRELRKPGFMGRCSASSTGRRWRSSPATSSPNSA